MQENRESFFSDIGDPKNILTGREALLSIKIWEKTVELIGICVSIDDTKSNLFKFVLRNDEGDKIQVLAWGNDGKRIQGYIKVNFIVHIDAGVARLKNTIHSLGTIPCDITVASHTVVNVLAKFENPSESLPIDNLEVIHIKDVMNCDNGTELIIEGHTNSEITELASGGGQTCLIDDVWKLEIKLIYYMNTDLKENQHVKVRGKIYNNSIPYLLVTDINNIKLTKIPPLTEADLLKGTQIPKRKAKIGSTNKEKIPKVETPK